MTIAAAFKFLTLADGSAEFGAGPGGIAILCFPLVGLVLGFILATINRAIEAYLSTEILALLLVAFLILATGAHHLAGAEKTFTTRAKQIFIAGSAGPLSIYGMLVVLLIVLFKSRAIEVAGEGRTLALLVTPLLARWSLVLFLFRSTPCASDAGARIANRVRSWHVVVVSVASLGFAFLVAGERALWMALCVSVLALLARGCLHRYQGGISLANCGAIIECNEALGLTLFASL